MWGDWRVRWGDLASLCKVLLAVALCLQANVGLADAGVARDLDKGSGLRGFNLGAMKAPPLTDGDYRQLAAYGANLVRIGVKVGRCDACSTFTMEPAEREYMESTVAMGRKHGFKVILAMTPEPGGEKAELWNRPDLRASLVTIWANVAASFKGNPVIAGYDLINEPVLPRDRNPTSIVGVVLQKSGLDSAGQDAGLVEWQSFAITLVQAIRAVDPGSVIIYEPSPWGLPKGFGSLLPLPFERIVYSFHFYEPHELTHQGIYKSHAGISYPNDNTSKASLSKHMDPVRIFAKKYSVPIYVGEFSIVRWAPGDSVQRYLTDVIDLFEAEGWNWSYHSYREYEGWDPEIDTALPRGGKAARSANTMTIRLLIDKGFSLNPPVRIAR